MLARLRYLLLEGFEVASLSGYDAKGKSGEDRGRASITYVAVEEGRRRLQSETFLVTGEEMRQCSDLYLRSLRRS